MRRLYYILLLGLYIQGAFASIPESIIPLDSVSYKQGETVHIQIPLDPSGFDLSSQEMVSVYPFIRSLDQTKEVTLDGIILSGKKRYKALVRSDHFNEINFKAPTSFYLQKEVDGSPLLLTAALPYESWMREAALLLLMEYTNCCNTSEHETLVKERLLPPVYIPEFSFSYIFPEVEEIKQRKEEYSAHLRFKVNDYVILENFEDNERILQEIISTINEVKNDSNLIITGINIDGYASPEGNFNANMKLSQNRALSFSNYLGEKIRIDRSLLSVNWHGEDWDGLYQTVSQSDIPEKDIVLDLIQNEPDINTRKRRLQRINNGSVYRVLLKEIYPSLRRNDYTINYIARPFDLEEAKALIRTKPHHLSLNEMFIVATSYPKGSPEYKEAFEIAARIYPESEVAKINAGISHIENGSYPEGLIILSSFDSAYAWNSLGICYFNQGEFNRAEEYFRKAADNGLAEGIHNVEQFTKWKTGQ